MEPQFPFKFNQGFAKWSSDLWCKLITDQEKSIYHSSSQIYANSYFTLTGWWITLDCTFDDRTRPDSEWIWPSTVVGRTAIMVDTLKFVFLLIGKTNWIALRYPFLCGMNLISSSITTYCHTVIENVERYANDHWRHWISLTLQSSIDLCSTCYTAKSTIFQISTDNSYKKPCNTFTIHHSPTLQRRIETRSPAR